MLAGNAKLLGQRCKTLLLTVARESPNLHLFPEPKIPTEARCMACIDAVDTMGFVREDRWVLVMQGFIAASKQACSEGDIASFYKSLSKERLLFILYWGLAILAFATKHAAVWKTGKGVSSYNLERWRDKHGGCAFYSSSSQTALGTIIYWGPW